MSINNYAQSDSYNFSNIRNKRISTRNITQIIDSVSIIPNSLSIQDISTKNYLIDEINSKLTWLQYLTEDSVNITYRIFPFKLNYKSRHNDFEKIRNNFLIESNNKINNALHFNNQNPLQDLGNINTIGSFGKGITFGNNQDASVNSTLNIQLSGIIGDSLELSAAISDNNIPIQPDGNTKNINDIDKIYIQLRKKNWQINFGDIDLKENNHSFLNFNKRIQGVAFKINNNLNKRIKNDFLISGAIAKGKFTRNIIAPIEGNQGPYKLKGLNNELYFVIIAGSERVFIDGVLLQRGEDLDYTIDYNTAEITFTPKYIITKDNRLQIEFEYIDRNYLNSQFFINDVLHINNNIKIKIGTYSNADSKYASIDQPLDKKEKILLSQIGDSIQNAFIENAIIDTLNANKLLYKKQDTAYNNKHDSIYVLSNKLVDILYNVSFSYVGYGKGNYKQISNAANGKAFQWIQPDINNNKNGDWEPITLLVTPKKLQILTIGLDISPTAKSKISTEFAVSNYDVNLFSNKEKSDNNGYATKISYQHLSQNSTLFNSKYSIEKNASFQYIQGKYKPIERLRDVEFLRNWSLPYYIKNTDEYLSDVFVNISGKKGGLIKYQFTNYKRSDFYNGNRNLFSAVSSCKYFKIQNNIDFLSYNDNTKEGFFLRPSIEISTIIKKINNIQIGTKYAYEKNKSNKLNSDTLLLESFNFKKYDIFINSNLNNPNKWVLNYYTRIDYKPNYDTLIKTESSTNYKFYTEILSNNYHQFRINATFRKLTIFRSDLSNQKADKTLLGRGEYSFNPKSNLLNGILLYEIGGGQEQKREYAYIIVPTGQGVYYWNDYNSNGIEELNEFEVAIYQDQKKYIRVYTPSNIYVKANFVQFNYSVNINPAEIIKSTSSLFNNILSRSNAISSLQLNKKNIANDHFLFNPFQQHSITDTNLVNMYSFLSNNYFFNKNSTKWGLDINHTISNSKALLSYGYENSLIRNLSNRLRLNITKQFITNFVYRNSKIEHNILGVYFKNQNYYIKLYSFENNLSYIYQSNFRATFSYIYNNKKNVIDSLEKASSNSFSGEIKYNLFSNTSLNVKCTYNKIIFKAYENAVNTSIGYLLLDGLVPGNNILWNVDIIKRVAGNMEINMQYEGRNTGSGKIINIGRASVRALF